MINSKYPLITLSEIATIYNGNSINKKIKQEKYTGIAIGRNFIATKDIGFDGQVVYENGVKIPYEESKFKTAPAGSVFVCSEGGSAGRKTAYITQEVCFGNKLYAIVGKDSSFVGKYIYYYTCYKGFSSQFQNLMNGIIGGVSLKKFGSILIPYPKKPVQEKIVTQVEEQLSQLDSAVATLKKSKQQLEIYRQAVLKEAFVGALTESEFKNFSLLKNYIEKPKYGTSKKCSYSITTDSKPVYRIPNIDTDRMRINKQDIKYAVFSNDELEKINLLDQDILIIRSNGSASLVGRAAILQKDDINATFAGYLMRLRIVNHNDLLPRFLLWYLQSHKARVYIESKAKSTSGVHNINSGEISSLQIPVFTIEEQKKIVKAVECRMSECDKIEQTVNQSLQQAEALRQSVLKQAFEEEYYSE